MLRALRHLSVGILLAICSSSSAQDNSATNETSVTASTDESAVRVKFDRSPDLPDGIAFSMSITNLLSMVENDSDFGISWIQEFFDVDEAKSVQLIGLFSEAAYDIETAIQESMQEIGCTTGVPRVYGDNTYKAFEQMEDTREAIAQAHLLQVKSQLDDDIADRLQAWIDDQKLNIVYSKTNHRKLSQKIGADGYERLERICQKFVEHSGETTQ